MRGNKGLLDKKRFKWMEQERIHLLMNLGVEETVKMMEAIISLSNELHGYFFPDNPCCLKIGLRKSKKPDENRRSIRQSS